MVASGLARACGDGRRDREKPLAVIHAAPVIAPARPVAPTEVPPADKMDLGDLGTAEGEGSSRARTQLHG